MTVTARASGEIWVQTHPWRTKCTRIDEGQKGMCHFNQVFKTEDLAEWAEQTHQHPFPHELVVTEHGMTLSTELWEKLDEVVDRLKSGDLEGVELEQLRGEARGIAWCLWRFQKPYYTSVAEVSRESLERWKMRNHKIPFRMTPGYKFSPMPNDPAHPRFGKPDGPAPTYTKPHNIGTSPLANGAGTATHVAASSTGGRRRTASQPAAAKKQLAEADIKSIKQGMSSGMFTAKDFAKVFGVTEADIEAAAKS